VTSRKNLVHDFGHGWFASAFLSSLISDGCSSPHVNGVGFWLANQELTNSKRAPLFCFSGPYTPDPKPVLDAWVAKERAKGMIKPGEYFGDGLVIEVALLVAYENAFPCTVKGR